VAAAGVALASVSWLRWSDLLIDSGRVHYVPWRLLHGDLLYRDLDHLFGPLSPYLHALLFGLFGTSVRTLAYFNLLVAALLAAGVLSIFGSSFGRWIGAACGLLFLSVFAFGHLSETGNYNFVGPYSPELTHSIALFFLLLPALARTLKGGSRPWAALCGALLGLIVLGKVEVFAASVGAVAAAFVLAGLSDPSFRVAARRAAAPLAAGFAAPVIAFAAFFASRAGLVEGLGMVFAGVTALGRPGLVDSTFYRAVSGLGEPVRNALIASAVAAGYAAALAAFVLLAGWSARFARSGRMLVTAFGVAALLAVAALLWDHFGLWELAGRPLPALLAAYLILAVRRAARGPGAFRDGRDIAATVALPVFALLLLLKIVLAVRFGHYGFALAMPAALFAAALALREVPAYVRRRGGCVATARVLVATLLVVIAARFTAQSLEWYRRMNYPVGGGADRILTFDPFYSNFGPVMRQTLQRLRTELAPGQMFVALPSGVMLNYLSRRRTPLRWFDFTPVDLASIGESRVVAALERARPGHALLVARPTGEFGVPYFGRDYGRALWAWMRRRYRPLHQVGSVPFAGRGFGIVIARRTGLRSRRAGMQAGARPPVMTRR
jgi:hypothetical protein